MSLKKKKKNAIRTRWMLNKWLEQMSLDSHPESGLEFVLQPVIKVIKLRGFIRCQVRDWNDETGCSVAVQSLIQPRLSPSFSRGGAAWRCCVRVSLWKCVVRRGSSWIYYKVVARATVACATLQPSDTSQENGLPSRKIDQVYTALIESSYRGRFPLCRLKSFPPVCRRYENGL